MRDKGAGDPSSLPVKGLGGGRDKSGVFDNPDRLGSGEAPPNNSSSMIGGTPVDLPAPGVCAFEDVLPPERRLFCRSIDGREDSFLRLFDV